MSPTIEWAVLAAVALVAAACTRSAATGRTAPRDGGTPTDPSGETPMLDAAPAREPLGGVPWQMDLFDDASDGGSGRSVPLGCVSVPLGARERRPIMIALHGGGDRPDWACGEWRGVTNAYPFLVCPRGPGASDRSLAWSSPADTKARIARAIAAAKRAFPEWVLDTSEVVLAGFSMGATQAARLAESEPRRYRRVALVESSYAPEPVMAFAAPWASGGGERVLFVCTTPGCPATYRSAARNVARLHAAARLDVAAAAEHGMWDDVVRSIRRDWPWLVDGVEGWGDYAAPIETSPLPGRTEELAPR